MWADRLLQLNPNHAAARSLKDQAVAALRASDASRLAGAEAKSAPTARWRVLTERARIRAAPSIDAETLATMPAGTLLPLAARADLEAEWLAITFDGRLAFVASRLTRPADAPQTARAPAERNYRELSVKPGQTSAWIQVPQGGCANWNADGAWVWIATPDGKVVLHSPGIRPTHIAFTASETSSVNVRYYIDPSGNCADAVP
jgi:hypothetical protein